MEKSRTIRKPRLCAQKEMPLSNSGALHWAGITEIKKELKPEEVRKYLFLFECIQGEIKTER